MTALDYFEGDELAASVWTDKYALRDGEDNIIEKNPDEMHRRIAKEFARIEAKKFKDPYTEDFIYSLLKDFGILIPQGSGMAGIGSSKYVSVSNCFVVHPPEDSYGGICYTDEQLVQICKRRGGVGTDISAIRPDNLPTTNSSRKATGILPFMDRFSNSIREVGQAGRRGALMITISVHHPQVLDFARVKLDPSKVTGANISIRLSNEFLKAVEANTDYEQRWPVNSPTPTISKLVNAREVWYEIIKCAHARAEPGLLFWDTILEESPADCYSDVGFGTISTNPCTSVRVNLLSKTGLVKIEDIKVGDEIWSEDGWVKVLRKVKTGTKEVYEYRTTSGVIEATDNHPILQKGNKVILREATEIDSLRGPYTRIETLHNQAVVDGLYLGDGTVHGGNTCLCIGNNDKDYFNSEIASYIHSSYSNGLTYKVSTTLGEIGYTYNRQIPDKYMRADRDTVFSFLRGLYSANGSVVSKRVTYKTASKELAKQLQILLSSVGISSYYTTNKPTKIKFKNGEYLCKESYDINISRDIDRFAESIGFIQKYKNEKLKTACVKAYPTAKPLTYKIVDRKLIGVEDVYDIEVSGCHNSFWCNGLNTSNCSELPLAILDSCRLLLINLFSCVEEAFTRKAKFNYDKLYQYAYYAERLMDDLVDIEIECVERIINKIKSDSQPDWVKQREIDLWNQVKDKAVRGRRTGLGPTALGDVIAALGFKYASDKSIEVVNKIYKTIKLAAYRSSVDMAKELGPFPEWNKDKEKNNPFLLRIKDEDPQLYKDMQKYGRRNIALLTTAPAGSTSIVAGPRPYFGKTSGIEPLFSDATYKRRKKINLAEDIKPDFIDAQGDKWLEYEVCHSMIKMWKDVTGKTDTTKSPYAGSCAEQIDWKRRVKLQAVANKHVDHAISSTLNLPEDVTVEQVAEIYETAWKEDCKGITVYRKNCRTGVLIDKDVKKKEGIEKTTAPKRPAELECDIHKTNINTKQSVVIVGLYEGEPYEVFAVVNETVPEKKGTIKKEKRGHYKLLYDETELDLTDDLTDEQAAILRLTSTSLRHGVDIAFIVHQLEKVKGTITGFAKGLARVLKKYIADGKAITGEECQSCKSASLVRQEGCVTCKSCGWSKCN